MVNFRPYILKAVVGTADDVIDPLTGVVTPGATKTVEFKCRATPNGKGDTTRSQDGNSVVYAWLIHADKSEDVIPYGVSVQVFDGLELVAEGKVLRSWSNQMNLRIWV